MIIARLFQLKNNTVELQIIFRILSQMIFPLRILLSDLSQFYFQYNHQIHVSTSSNSHKPYKEYIINEQHNVQMHLDRDIHFWEKYLEDGVYLLFRSVNVLKNMKSQQLSYSTYSKIPETELSIMKQFCAHNHISINDGLCAATALALLHCSNHEEPETTYICMNIVKSTRNNEVYDDTIGCFLRLEPVKIALNKNSDLTTLSQQIHQSTIETSLYQQCPDLVKLSSISTFRQKRKIIKGFLLNILASIYTAIFTIPEINRKVFKLCSKRLISFQRTNDFLININIHRNFISETPKNKVNLFGLDMMNIKNHQYDLLKIDNIFDVCFLRDDDDNSPYMVISANLKPDLRELIAKETIRLIGSSSLINPPEMKSKSTNN